MTSEVIEPFSIVNLLKYKKPDASKPDYIARFPPVLGIPLYVLRYSTYAFGEGPQATVSISCSSAPYAAETTTEYACVTPKLSLNLTLNKEGNSTGLYDALVWFHLPTSSTSKETVCYLLIYEADPTNPKSARLANAIKYVGTTSNNVTAFDRDQTPLWKDINPLTLIERFNEVKTTINNQQLPDVFDWHNLIHIYAEAINNQSIDSGNIHANLFNPHQSLAPIIP